MTVAELLAQQSAGKKEPSPRKEGRAERRNRAVSEVPLYSSVKLPFDAMSKVQDWAFVSSVRGNRVELVLTGRDGKPSIRWANKGNFRPTGDRDGTLTLARW
jgi:hypothetical protein